MIAYLEKSMENADFDKIVDFLIASPIRYSLTISLTIYVSYIEQFWSNAKIKTGNNQTQIHAEVNGKTVIITESSVRRDLHFNDEDGTITPLFPSMLASQAVEGEVDETIYEERGDSVERAATTTASLDADQDSGNIIRTQSMATHNEPISQGTSLGSGPRRQDTIFGDIPAQTRFERLSKQSNYPPLSRVNTLGSGEDSMKLNELMEIYTRLSERVLVLENIKTAQNLEIINLKKRVKKLEKKKKARTPQLKRRLFKVRIESSVKKSLGDQEDASKQGRNGIDQDEEISWFQEDAETRGDPYEIRSVKSKEKSKEKGVSSETTVRPTRGVIMKEASETITRPIVPPQQQLDPKDKGKGIMQEPEKPVKVKGKD
ncbi:hypothetical protein Tco_0827047 [Tanacetum coccineum]